MTQNSNALPNGYYLDRYEIVRVLGAGGFGITYLAYDDEIDGPVAIKEYLPPEFAARRESDQVVVLSSTLDEDFQWGLERFVEEARHVLRFNHPHIVGVERYLKANGTAYIVMQYIEGPTLTQYLNQHGTLEEDQLKPILMRLIDGLEVVHETGLLHRDIQPGNIVMRGPGDPVLIDFGAARFATSQHSRRLTRIICPGYSPYEQYAENKKQGPWTDIYALAAVCYMALTGTRPDDCNNRIRNDPLEPLVRAAPDKGSETFLAAIDWGMAVFETDRPSDVTAWRKALLGESPPKDSSSSSKRHQTRDTKPGGSPESNYSSPRRWAIMAAVVLLIALSAALTPSHLWREAMAMIGLMELHELDLEVSPAEAAVRLRGQGYDEDWQPGKRFPAGEYELTISEPFYQDSDFEITLPQTNPASISLDRLQFPLTVNTHPADASVELVETGVPVINGELLRAGEYTLRASAEFYQDKNVPIRLDRPLEKTINLERARHELTIRVSPADADASIELIEPAETYQPGMQLPAGRVVLEVSSPGYETKRRDFNLDSDTPILVELECESRTVEEEQCEERTRTRYRTESEERSERMSAYEDHTGSWAQPAWDVCDAAERRAQRALRADCDRKGSYASLSDRSSECAWRSDCRIWDRRGNPGYFQERYKCEGAAYGRCEWSEDRQVPYQENYQHCETVEVERPVCD